MSPAPTAAAPPAATPPAATRPPVADLRAPRLRLAGARGTARGRTVTVRMRVTSDEDAALSARLGRAVARRSLRAGRPAVVVLRTRVGVRPPRSVRVALGARDAHGNRTRLRPTVRLSRKA
jgi:hypothetical protein